jgi:hypothetical protein
MSSKNEEVAALEALRDSSGELVKYLDAMNEKLTQLNQQNECTSASPLRRGIPNTTTNKPFDLRQVSLRVLENWSSVIAITKTTSAADRSDDAAHHEILRKPL